MYFMIFFISVKTIPQNEIVGSRVNFISEEDILGGGLFSIYICHIIGLFSFPYTCSQLNLGPHFRELKELSLMNNPLIFCQSIVRSDS